MLQMTSFVLGSIARRVRSLDSAGSPGSRPQLDTARFVEDLIAMASAMLLVPVPGVPASV